MRTKSLFGKLIILAVCLAAVAAWAWPSPQTANVTLAWDKSPDPSVGSYTLYWGVAPRNYTNFIVLAGANTTTGTISNLLRGTTYYFAVTCSTTNGLESAFSAEVNSFLPAPPLPVQNLRISGIGVFLMFEEKQ